MQRTLRRRLADNPPHAIIGTAVVLVAVTALVVVSFLYVHPLGQKTISFEATDASSLTTGQDVRVAGINIGKISNITLEPDSVRVEAEVDNDVFIGDESRVEIRMLTPVGGYAVTMIPLGDDDLGDAVIPRDRVTVPYSIGDILQAAPDVTDEVKGETVDANIDQVAVALQHNPESLGSIISGMRSIATVMDRQREQVRTVMDLAAEYLESFDGSREFVFDLIRRADIVLTTYNNAHAGFNAAYRMLGDVLERVSPIAAFYLNHTDEVESVIDQLRTSIAQYQQDLGPAIDQLQGLRDRLAAWLGPDGMQALGGGVLTASSICVPIPGRTC